MVISVDDGVVTIHASLAALSLRRLATGDAILTTTDRVFVIPAHARARSVLLGDGTVLPAEVDAALGEEVAP